jgi:hypothetical protein
VGADHVMFRDVAEAAHKKRTRYNLFTSQSERA